MLEDDTAYRRSLSIAAVANCSNVKQSFAGPCDLKTELDGWAQFDMQTYGVAVNVSMVIPAQAGSVHCKGGDSAAPEGQNDKIKGR